MSAKLEGCEQLSQSVSVPVRGPSGGAHPPSRSPLVAGRSATPSQVLPIVIGALLVVAGASIAVLLALLV
jgi:hypothetical protein